MTHVLIFHVVPMDFKKFSAAQIALQIALVDFYTCVQWILTIFQIACWDPRLQISTLQNTSDSCGIFLSVPVGSWQFQSVPVDSWFPTARHIRRFPWVARSAHSGREAPAAGAKRPLAAEGRAVALELHIPHAKNRYSRHDTSIQSRHAKNKHPRHAKNIL